VVPECGADGYDPDYQQKHWHQLSYRVQEAKEDRGKWIDNVKEENVIKAEAMYHMY